MLHFSPKYFLKKPIKPCSSLIWRHGSKCKICDVWAIRICKIKISLQVSLRSSHILLDTLQSKQKMNNKYSQVFLFLMYRKNLRKWNYWWNKFWAEDLQLLLFVVFPNESANDLIKYFAVTKIHRTAIFRKTFI